MIRAARRRARHVNDAFEFPSETCREKGREHCCKGINKNRLNKSAFSQCRSKMDSAGAGRVYGNYPVFHCAERWIAHTFTAVVFMSVRLRQADLNKSLQAHASCGRR